MYSKFRNTMLRISIGTLIVSSIFTSVSTYSSVALAVNESIQADTISSHANDSYPIVVLGDSLAAGYQLGFDTQSIPYGFAEHVYEQALFHGLRAEYTNYGIIGLTTADLNTWLRASVAQQVVTIEDIPSSELDPRADSILLQTNALTEDIKKAKLILLSIGGNDFLSLVKELGVDTAFNLLPATKQTALTEQLDAIMTSYELELHSILSTLKELQPHAEVIISNQYLPIPKILNSYLIPESSVLFLKEGQARLSAIINKLLLAFKNEDLTLKIADVATPIEQNALLYTTISKGDYHPTVRGYEQLGRAFTEQIWDEYKTIQPREQNVPISVVVNGNEVLTDYTPTLLFDRTFLSLRDISNAADAQLEWDIETQTATFTLADRTVAITIGANTIVVNGLTVPLNTEPAYLQPFPAFNEVKTFVPLAALSEGLGLQVVYRKSLQTAFITN